MKVSLPYLAYLHSDKNWVLSWQPSCRNSIEIKQCSTHLWLLRTARLKMRSAIILLNVYLNIASTSSSIQKFFDKKYVTSKSLASSTETKTLYSKSAEQMNKITCSSLCLRDSGEGCHAFRVNDDNECKLIKYPELLQEVSAHCIDDKTPFIWTSKYPECKSYKVRS